jgi:hypothetical protein
MLLFLFLSWCAAVAGRSGGPNIIGDNSRSSRFGEFNSRLGRANSRFGLPRELAGKGFIWLPFFSEKRRLRGQNRRNSRLNGKSRELSYRRNARVTVPPGMGRFDHGRWQSLGAARRSACR